MQTMTAAFAAILERDLTKLADELQAFEQEENIWKTCGHITNPAGNLCLHLVGNLNTYNGAVLGGSGYIRKREAEFSRRDIPRNELVQQVEQTRRTVHHTLLQLPEEQLQQPDPQLVLDYDMTTGYFLVHLTGHLSYHLSQLNYLRRLLE